MVNLVEHYDYKNKAGWYDDMKASNRDLQQDYRKMLERAESSEARATASDARPMTLPPS